MTAVHTDATDRSPSHDSVLDNLVWHSLTGPHADLAETLGRARRYPTDVSPFAALPDDASPHDWADLAGLVGPGQTVLTTGRSDGPPADWEQVADIPGVQMVDTGVDARPDDEALRLGPADVPEMLDLVARTQPGPFLPRTITLGTYLGIRLDGELVAIAGQRLRPAGWIEISAVCTDPGRQGLGLAGRLVRAVAVDIREQGSTPLLHTGAGNTNAIRLYEKLGFSLRRRTTFTVYRTPAPPA